MEIFVVPDGSGGYHILNRGGQIGEATHDKERNIYGVWLNLEGFLSGKVAIVYRCDDRWRVDPEVGDEMVDDDNATYASVEDAICAGVVTLVKARS